MPQMMLVFYLTLFVRAVQLMPSQEIQIVSDSIPDVDGEPVDLLVSFRMANGRNDQRLFGSFSVAGRNYETSGDVVQVFPYRACDIKRKGHDRTLIDHIAVVFFDELEPFIVGCVSLDNQVRFAEKSGALGLVVGPESRVVTQINKLQRGRIPVVILDDLETKRFKKQLDEASQYGSIVKLSLQYVQPRPQYTLRLQVFRPTILNISLIILLMMLVLFITGLVLIKIKWKPTSHRDLWLRTLARSAVNKMEIRKFEKVSSRSTVGKKSLRKDRSFFCITGKQKYLPVFGSLSSVAPSSTIQERCSICLEEYKEGQELRVLFCGHEFHPKCVDPWLLNNRRCPLCQYDVVYKEYPRTSAISKTCPISSLPRIEPPNSQESPLLAPDMINYCEVIPHSYNLIPEKKAHFDHHQAYRFLHQNLRKGRRYRSRDCKRRAKIVRSRSARMHVKRRCNKPKKSIDAFPGSSLNNGSRRGFSNAFSGYSSDISSYMESEDINLTTKPVFTHSQTIASIDMGKSSFARQLTASCHCRTAIPLNRISGEDLYSNFIYSQCKLPSCRLLQS